MCEARASPTHSESVVFAYVLWVLLTVSLIGVSLADGALSTTATFDIRIFDSKFMATLTVSFLCVNRTWARSAHYVLAHRNGL